MRSHRHRTRGTSAILVTLLVLVGSTGAFLLAGPSPAPSPAATAPTIAPSPAATHGDLVVGAGETFVIQPSLSGPTYYQGGNITVQSGGTLLVENVTLSFVSYVATTGTAAQRLSHIYGFADQGTVEFEHANLTTDAQVINAYAKLNLTVTGTLTAWDSTFAFPGWLNVLGSAASATFNGSAITGNPGVGSLPELTAILGDTLWAPTISVTAGGQLNLFGSYVNETYADNTALAGYPRPAPLAPSAAAVPVAISNGLNLSVTQSSDAQNLTLDWLYPNAGVASGYVTVNYTDKNPGPGNNSAATPTVWYAGTAYALGAPISFRNGTSGSVELPFPSALVAAIASGGLLSYINHTGAFDTPNAISVSFGSLSGPSVTLDEVTFQLNTTGPSYNLLVSGPGSALSTVDTQIDLTWTPAPTSIYAQSAPFPWNSNKLLIQNGAVAHLANLTTPTPLPGVFANSSVVPDASSQVYFYRWAEFGLTGRGGGLPVQGASLSAYYAYGSGQANNQTANALNALATADPAIWGYVQYWDSAHGVAAYATSNAVGDVYALLASGDLSGPTLPDGVFLGNYHIGLSVPAVSVASQWLNWSVSPYPEGVAANTAQYNGPDVGPAQRFEGYYGAMDLAPPVVTADGTLATAVRIGQSLGVSITLTDNGTATVTEIGASLWYDANSTSPLATVSATGLDLNTPGTNYSFNLTWVVNDTVTGLHGTFAHTFFLSTQWNGGSPSLGGGEHNATLGLTVTPSQIRVVSATAPPGSVDLTGSYSTQGVIQYNGSKAASILLVATPTNGGNQVEIGATTARSGPFVLPWLALDQLLSAGTTYTLTVIVSYNGVSSPAFTAGTFSVPSTAGPQKNVLFETFYGLPIWTWIAIAAAAVAAALLFLLFARRGAAGKLVECGECGNLIPEEATVCPKCGAEFETDLIRCSRCASTIPASSKVCPECSAQLLGKAGESGSEPERQGYADFTEKFRAEAKRELGDNFSEGGFWDWWKRQPTYTPFGQWKLQQGQGTSRTGMAAPPSAGQAVPEAGPKGPEASVSATPPVPEATAQPSTPAPAAAATGSASLKACPNCGKEIPPEYLVCPFCGAVTQ